MPSNKRNHRVNPDHRFTVGRFGIIFAITSFIAVCIAVCLFRTTVVYADEWNRMGYASLADSMTISPMRGEILASDGSILATNLYYYNILIDFRASGFKIVEYNKAIPELADSLAKYFTRYDRAKWEKRLRGILDVPKNKRTRNFVIAAAVPQEMVARVKKFPFFRECKTSYSSGLKAEQVMKRAYPFGKMARLSIGRTGMTAEDPEIHGRSGLECALDTLLYGTPGLKVKTLSTRGSKYAVVEPAIDGYDVYTTIDITMQDILENELGQMLLDAQAEWGSAMIMEVATGDIKAISNLELDKKSATPRYIEALNRTVMRYEPGSVMKVMTMAVALEKGWALPVSREYSIGRSYRYLGNRPINDTHSPATLPIDKFIEYSSNIGMVKLMMPHYESNPKQFKEDLAELGFFDEFNTGIAYENPPKFIKNPSRIDLSRMVFGYTTMISPLYTCAFYNAVANDGRFVRPRLVKGLRTPDGRDSIIPVSYIRERMMSPTNAALLRKMMRGVVWEQGGTAKVLKSDAVEIAGKTGTCKIALVDDRPRVNANGDSIKLPPFKGGYREGHYRVTFCGFFPYESPKYTCVVVINDPKVPYRGPAVSSGTVLKNVALKMNARGMLAPDPVFMPSPNTNSVPTVYSSFDHERNSVLHRNLHISRSKAIRTPDSETREGHIPCVKGVSLREALAKLESMGYAVDFTGIGYVYNQEPEAGTPASPGTRVRLALRN